MVDELRLEFRHYRRRATAFFAVLALANAGALAWQAIDSDQQASDIVAAQRANCQDFSGLKDSLLGILTRGRQVLASGQSSQRLTPQQHKFALDLYDEWIGKVRRVRCHVASA